VETVELLSHVEVRRQVSVDFTLTDEEWRELETEQGVLVPIALMTKQPRRRFSLRDESGSAVPVLGRDENAELAQVAVLGAVLDALDEDPSGDLFESLASDVEQIVARDSEEAEDALAYFLGSSDQWRAAIAENETAGFLLNALWNQYVLYAVLPPGGPKRRVLKYSYAERLPSNVARVNLREVDIVEFVKERLSHPDRRRFIVECPGAAHARSFHVELAVPEELQFEAAVLWDFESGEMLSGWEEGVDRASLFAPGEIPAGSTPDVWAVVAASRGGRTFSAALTAGTIAVLLWLGVHSGLPTADSTSAVAIITAGAALFSGVAAIEGAHKLVKHMFAAPRRWLALVSFVALIASALYALGIPSASPVDEWRVAAIITTVASVRLGWSALRSPPR
jgi:hypothetical protein